MVADNLQVKRGGLIGTEKPAVQGTAAFSKGIALMQLVADSDNPTKNDLQRMSGPPRQTLHRLLKALIAEQLVECSEDNTYQLGTRMLRFAGRAIEQNRLLQCAESELRKLTETTLETTHLAVRNGLQMVYLLKHDTPQTVRLATHVGGRVDLHASSIGKSVLAFLPEDERDEILDGLAMPAITEHTVTCIDELRKQIADISVCGYCVASEESELGVQCFGAPVFDHRHRPIAGISISVPLFRLKDDLVEHYVAPLLATCRTISQKYAG